MLRIGPSAFKFTPVHSPAVKIPRLKIRSNAIGHQLRSGIAGLHCHIAVARIIADTSCNNWQLADRLLLDREIQTGKRCFSSFYT